MGECILACTLLEISFKGDEAAKKLQPLVGKKRHLPLSLSVAFQVKKIAVIFYFCIETGGTRNRKKNVKREFRAHI